MSTDSPDFRDAVVKDNIVFGSFSVSLDGQTATETPRLPDHDPARILRNGVPDLFRALRWDYGLVSTLYGRQDDLDAILDWADDGEASVAVRLISGPGGAGKTRLAVEAARELRNRGWAAGLLRVGADSGRVIDARGRVPGKGLFLIIDYPEERMGVVEGLLRDVADIASTPVPIRFLLVSRRGFAEWEREVRKAHGEIGGQELAIPESLAVADALGILTEAAETFAQITKREVPSLTAAEAWLADSPTRRLPLFAMAAGVHAVLTGRGDFALGASELMHELAKRELARVQAISEEAGLGSEGLARLLALALFSGTGLDQEQIERLGAANLGTKLVGQDLLDAVAKTPWWVEGPMDWYLARLEPDRPAAAFLEQVLLRKPSLHLPDWIYAATSQDSADFGPRLSRLAYDLAGLSPDERGAEPLEHAVLGMIEANPERVRAFRRLGDEQGTVFTASFAAKILMQMLAETENDFERANMLNNLASQFMTLGRPEEALAAYEQAVEDYLAFVVDRPDVVEPYLASALNNLSLVLAKLGRHEEALTIGGQAVALRRRLAEVQPQAFRLELAQALSNLSNRLRYFHLYNDALTVSEEAVAICRSLGNTQSHALEPELARALNNFSICLSRRGRHDEALASIEEAVVLRRRLAKDRPDAFERDLASSLHNLSDCLSKVGRHDEALAVLEEAVVLRRRLATAHPDAFEPDLALTLNSLASCLSELGRPEEALVAIKEAVAFRRRLAEARPDAFEPDLAGSLHNLSGCLSDLGRPKEALVASEEAVRRLQPYFMQNPQIFARQMQVTASGYFDFCEAEGVPSDRELLKSIDDVLWALSQRPDGTTP